MSIDIQRLTEEVQQEIPRIASLRTEINRILVGQTYMVDRLLVSLLCGGHVLVEGLPGLAKTTAIKTLGACVQASFSRIQFTPDLLPADVVGTLVYNPKESSFFVKKGPIFANLVLADEINRAPAKVQSALLEVMQEHQVTIGSATYVLDEPFLVMATQNPIEQQGTYPLPEAQVDRFMLKLKIEYPTFAEELEIMNRNIGTQSVKIEPILTPSDLLKMKNVVENVYLDEKLKNYILQIVHATRKPTEYKLGKLKQLIFCGASPRASINLALASKALAFISGRAYVTPQDVKLIAPDVLRHRILVSYEAEAEDLNSDNIIKEILASIDVP